MGATKMLFAPKISVKSHTFPVSFSNVTAAKLDIHHINFQIVGQHGIVCSTKNSNDALA